MSNAEKKLLTRKPSYKVHMNDCRIQFVDGHYGLQQIDLRAGTNDFIIRRADGVFAYQLAVSYDDAVMEITRVIRGRDLLDSTPKQIWLMQQMDYEPPQYCHVPLLVVNDGRKMSKRNGDLSMEVLRKTHTSEQLCGKLAYVAGLLKHPEPVSPTDLIAEFNWDKIPTENIMLPENLF